MNISNIPGGDKRFFIIVASCLLLLSSFLHFWKIGEVPGGFFVDESSVAYNAWSLSVSGRDENGAFMPLFIKSFDIYFSPVGIYSLAAFFKVFDPSTTGRAVSAIYFLMASFMFYFLAYKLSGRKWLSLAGAFAFLILPWTFPLSRTIMGGYMPMIFFMTAGSYFLIRAIGEDCWKQAFAAGLSWSMAMYSHNTGRPMTAVLLVGFVLAYNVLLLKRWRTFLIFVVVYVLSLVPMMVAVWNNTGILLNRFKLVSVWHDQPGAYELFMRMAAKYLEYFKPQFFFINGDSNIRHGTGNAGIFFLFMAPLIIAGLYVLLRWCRHNPVYRFLVIAILSYPIPGILTTDHYHAARTISGAPFWCIAAVLGAVYLWRNVKMFKILLIIIPLMAVYEIPAYFRYYFREYAAETRLVYAGPIIEAIRISDENMRKGEILYLSGSVFPQRVDRDFKPFWYIHVLFFLKIPPEAYQQGRIHDYARPYGGKVDAGGVLVVSNKVWSFDKQGDMVSIDNPEKLPENRKLIGRVEIDGSTALEIYRVDK
ncbi:MAG: glycosyltransferase family 39 protein [Victivallales bacterium]